MTKAIIELLHSNIKGMLTGFIDSQGLADIREFECSIQLIVLLLGQSKFPMADSIELRGNSDTMRGTGVFGCKVIKTIKNASDARIEPFGKLQSVVSQQILQEEALSNSDTAGNDLLGADLFKDFQEDQCTSPYGIKSLLFKIEFF